MTKNTYIAYSISLLDQAEDEIGATEPPRKYEVYKELARSEDEDDLATQLIAMGVASSIRIRRIDSEMTDVDPTVEVVIDGLESEAVFYESVESYKASLSER